MRPKVSTTLALLAALACIAPGALRAALAGAAGLLFEAVPFVLAAELVSRYAHAAHPRQRRLADWALRLTGCGCGQPGGAVSLAALGLCWIAFGPAVALGRAALALVALRFPARGSACTASDAPGALTTLSKLAVPAILGAAGAAFAASLPAQTPWPAAFALGATLGSLIPCVPASVAIAAALRAAAPATAAGLLATAGIITLRRPRPSARVPDHPAALITLGAACIWLVARHGAALIHPRLLPLMAASAAASIWLAARPPPRPREPAHVPQAQWIVLALLLATLIAGSPPPSVPRADPTTLSDAFSGQPLHFCGMTRHNTDGSTTLVRYIITCCRADASPIGIRLDRPLTQPDGTWVDATGTAATDTHGLFMHVHALRTVQSPADPFLYR